MGDLQGRTALTTGAGRGMGAVDRALDADGVSLGLASRRGDDLEIEYAVGGLAGVPIVEATGGI